MSNSHVVQATIGAVAFLIENSADSGPVKEASKSETGQLGIRQTSPPLQKLTDSARENLIDVVDQIRSEFHKHWEQAMASTPGPSEMSLEVSFSFESEINAWVISGKGSAGIKAAFTWTRVSK